MSIFEAVFGTHSEKEIKRITPLVDKIVALDESMQALSDDDLKSKTDEFKKRFEQGESLDDLLIDAFAVVREADKPSTWNETLSGADYGWYSFASGKNSRNENRRR